MDSSLAALTAQPRPIEVGGVVYLFHPIRIEDLGSMQAWCDARRPSPFKVVSGQLGNGLFTPAQERELLQCAVREAARPTPRIGASAECDELLMSLEGLAKILHLSVGRGNPGFTEAQAEALLRSMDAGQLAEMNSVLDTGLILRGGDDPKAPTGGGSSTTP